MGGSQDDPDLAAVRVPDDAGPADAKLGHAGADARRIVVRTPGDRRGIAGPEPWQIECDHPMSLAEDRHDTGDRLDTGTPTVQHHKRRPVSGPFLTIDHPHAVNQEGDLTPQPPAYH